MSGPGFGVDPERLRAHAGELDGIAERAGRIAADLQQALDASGAPWGRDVVGQSFAAAHEAPAADALSRVSDLPSGLSGMGQRLTDAAGAYAAAEETAIGDLDEPGSGLEGA